MMDYMDIREVILKVIEQKIPRRPGEASLHASGLLAAVERELKPRQDIQSEQMILTVFYDLFRTGYLSWGHNMPNPDPPFCHVTERGMRAIQRPSRDPGNPGGYLRHVQSRGTLPPIARSYLNEGLETYVSGQYKAAAVMIGAAFESLILELRDEVIAKMTALNLNIPKALNDWKIKMILDEMQTLFDSKKKDFSRELRESFEAYWSAFSHQIRTTRNEAGHPSSIDPVTEDMVHASFLIFPNLAWLCSDLLSWVKEEWSSSSRRP